MIIDELTKHLSQLSGQMLAAVIEQKILTPHEQLLMAHECPFVGNILFELENQLEVLVR